MRCLSLARELRERGATVWFAMQALPGDARDLVTGAGFAVRVLSELTELTEENSDLALVDHYRLGAEWERATRRFATKIAVIDDLADRPHDCDALLDQNFFVDAASRYAGLLPPGAVGLFGPHFALLRPDFAAARATLTEAPEAARRLFVMFGGTDPSGETAKVLAALTAPGLRDVSATIVCGKACVGLDAIRAASSSRPGLDLHLQSDRVADLMRGATLAVGAAGSATWERMCVGVPSLLAVVAANQRPIALGLRDHGYVDLVNESETALATEADYVRALMTAFSDRSRRARQRAQGLALVDGLGAGRVAGQLLALVAASSAR